MRLVSDSERWSANDDLANVLAPCLACFRRDVLGLPPELGRDLAKQLPNAQLAVLNGDALLPYLGDVPETLSVIERFLGIPSDTSPQATSFQTIMFTDLESSTALTQKVGDAAAQDVLHGHNDAVRKSLEDNGGRAVKHTGDGIMAAFPSAVRAVEAALQIERDLAGGEVRVRIGLNAGEPIAEDDDFFGTAVQLAARVCDRAEPGQVLVSRVVADLWGPKTPSEPKVAGCSQRFGPSFQRLLGVRVPLSPADRDPRSATSARDLRATRSSTAPP